MHNPFTKHPRENTNETWWRHCKFAVGVGIRLFFTSLIFIVHGILPFLLIPRWLNLEDSISFLNKENSNRETKKQSND